jgi:glycosyltransferase involved in cell wall biosynthesis
MTADAGQKDGALRSGEYASHSAWAHEPKASLQMSKWRFLAGALANLPSSLPYAVARFRSAKLSRQVARLISLQQHDVVVSDFLFPAASLPWELKARAQAPWVLFQHNVESMIWRRRAEGMNGIKGLYWKAQRDRMLRFESRVSARFDGVLAVSDEDARIFSEELGLTNVCGVVPTGVDLDYFQALPKTPSTAPTVVFMGSMDWYANVDGVKWFAEAVWPHILRIVPDARFVVVGRKPPPDIEALAATGMRIEITGTVPDVRPFLRGADVIVVPLRIGGGTLLRDIARDAQNVLARRAHRPGHERCRSILADVAVLDRVGIAFIDLCNDMLHRPLAIIRMDELDARARHELFGTVTHQLHERGVHALEVTLE